MRDAMKSLPPEMLKKASPSEMERGLRASVKSRAMRLDTHDLATRVAVAILAQRREITMGEIRAIPFVHNDSDAQRVFTYLLEHLPTETGQRKIASNPVLRWERFIRLKENSSATPDKVRFA